MWWRPAASAARRRFGPALLVAATRCSALHRALLLRCALEARAVLPAPQVVPDAAPPVVRLMEVSKYLYEQVRCAVLC